VSYTAAPEVYFQVLWYERAVPEEHLAHDGGLLRLEPVAGCRVGAAVDAPNPAELLIYGPHARRLDDREDALVARYESRNTIPLQVVFRALLGDDDREVHFEWLVSS